MSGSNKRVKNLAVCRPIIYGNTAVPLQDSDRKPDTPPDHTHKWTIFLRDPNNEDEDLGYFVKKVAFKLHDTYPQPLRTIESFPFEVTETGWGEFEITIRIFFAPHAGEKNILLYHHLKLHPYNPTTGVALPPDAAVVGQLVESVLYDELVFNEPTETMFEILTSRPGALLPAKKTSERRFAQQTENEELDRLGSALDTVYVQVQTVKEQITALEKEKLKLEGEKTPSTVETKTTAEQDVQPKSEQN
jgi:YEATS domain-containing protein 4